MEVKKPCVIACAVLALDIRKRVQELNLDVDSKFLRGGLHNRPALLHEELQRAIDEVSAAGRHDRIIIGYGVCGRGTVGLRARDIPLVIGKVHDCIALFLGGDAVYQREFKKNPGTYYISAGWYEEKTEPHSQRRRSAHFGDQKLDYDDLVQRYGEPTARETFRFLNSWQKNYQRAVFIETGAGGSAKYAEYARRMAAEHGWHYERIRGDARLIKALLTARQTTSEILVVPPGHSIEFDALRSTLSANPVWETPTARPTGEKLTVVADDAPPSWHATTGGLGLGIDAGGTYTDVVIYERRRNQTLCKSKALTTKWDFTVGIGRALDRLDRDQLQQVEIIAVSTTLATNAIVEGHGQKVGMIVMPPHGRLDAEEIPYEPKAMIAGQLEIGGKELVPVDPGEVARVARRMVAEHQVKAFAVSGYGGAINPAHELAVAQIIREITGLAVTCGHELSGLLNFKTRAHTAMLNARIIPNLAKLLEDLEHVFAERGICVPVVVVKGDGTLMSAGMARQRPVETILSGPAASVAGARHLTGLQDALVVDMGGTTTDTALLTAGAVSVCDSGSNIGGNLTHVKALAINTVGLGGDSLISWQKGDFTIGPRRVTPVSRVGATYEGIEEALAYFDRHLDRYRQSGAAMQLLILTGATNSLSLTPLEEQIVTLLASRPYPLDELIRQTGVLTEAGLRLERLEEQYIVQRSGLTPTDLLHVTGRFQRWDKATAERLCAQVARLAGMDLSDLATRLLRAAMERLAVELLKRQLTEETDPAALETCPVCRTLLSNLLAGGNDRYRVHVDFQRPVVGIGAPIHYFLPQAAAALGAEALLPQDADVANAIGAITSEVVIQREVRIVANSGGEFLIEGLPGAPRFGEFVQADAKAHDALVRLVRDQARAAGTSSRKVVLQSEDELSSTADGTRIFLGRTIRARLSGPPDLAVGDRCEANGKISPSPAKRAAAPAG